MGVNLQMRTAANQKPRRPVWVRRIKHRHQTVSLGAVPTGPNPHAPAWRTRVVGLTHSASTRRMGLCSSTTQRAKPGPPIRPLTPPPTINPCPSPCSLATWTHGPTTNSEQVGQCTMHWIQCDYKQVRTEKTFTCTEKKKGCIKALGFNDVL